MKTLIPFSRNRAKARTVESGSLCVLKLTNVPSMSKKYCLNHTYTYYLLLMTKIHFICYICIFISFIK